MNDIKRLQDKIEKLRQKMSSIALEKGISNEKTIAISQELDKLITNYQRHTMRYKEID